MNFQELQGNEFFKNSLNALETQNRMPHAIIISGGTAENRNALATHLAMWGVCSGENKPCHACKDCINSKSHSHSDIYYAKGEGKTNIFSKKEISNIIKDSYTKPNQANKKVYVFEECDRRFTEISQNAFLKTLEEPPQNVLFIMTCESSKSMLSTILSRSTVFSLKNQQAVDENSLALAKEITQGIIAVKEIDLLVATNKLDKRETAFEALNLVVELLRDGLVASLGNDPIIDKDIAFALCKRLTKVQYLKLIEITQEAAKKVSQNISLKLISTWLCGEYRRISWQR